MNGLDLFSGIGGFSFALQGWITPIAYCENDRYAQSVLLDRMSDGSIKMAPIWDDIRTLRASHLPVVPDIIYGGFPCQDLSTAGRGAGLEGKRSILFFEVSRLIGELRPRFVFLENVPAIAVRGLDRVLLEITSLRNDSRWTTLSAESVGACHKRERWFSLAHANGQSLWIEQEQEFDKPNLRFEPIGDNGTNPDPTRSRLEGPHGQGSARAKSLPKPAGYNEWTSEPCVRGRNHGIPHRLDRLKCLGNSVVPLQALTAFEGLVEPS